MAKIAHVQWYATVFRGDQLERALQEIAPVALRYGATEYLVMRAGDDRYRMHQFSWFENKLDWDSFWLGPEFEAWRADFSSFYQVPLVYSFADQSARGEIAEGADVDRVH